jgi:DNA polymerase elongation subunit (family B)
MAYALDDVQETLGVSAVLAPPYFAQAQVVPFDYQSTTLRGAAAKIDALLLREYLHRRRAVPRPRPGTSVGGALVNTFLQGVARPVLHVDVTSLYPSLMLGQGIAPAADDLGIFLDLLRHLRDFRITAKRLAREAEGSDRAHLGAIQQSFKILINAFYGYLAFGSGHWNDYAAADRVTTEGRAVVGAIIERLGALGAAVVEADTDGVYFVPPPGHERNDDEALVERVAAGLPAGIVLELDGRHPAMFSYKPKTYALVDERGRVSLKGSAFRSRGLEPFLRLLIEEIVGLLLAGRGADVKGVVGRWMEDFAARRVAPRLFARTETLGETIEAYRDRVQNGLRNVSAAYELAAASGRPWQPGDQVAYYVAGRGAGVAVAECARFLSAWDPARPDENVDYYRAKVWETWERFRPFAEHEGLRPPNDDAESPQLTLF